MGHDGAPPRQWLDEQHFSSMPNGPEPRGGRRQAVRASGIRLRSPLGKGLHGQQWTGNSESTYGSSGGSATI